MQRNVNLKNINLSRVREYRFLCKSDHFNFLRSLGISRFIHSRFNVVTVMSIFPIPAMAMTKYILDKTGNNITTAMDTSKLAYS